MRVNDAIRRSGISIEADHTVHQAAVLMEQAGVGSLAVLDEGRLVGIVTDRDLVRRAMAPALALSARVDAVMTMPVETIESDSDLHDAVSVFRDRAVRRLAVVDHDRFVGMLTVDDLIIDLASDLAAVVRPVTAEAIFAHHDAPVPATTPDAG